MRFCGNPEPPSDGVQAIWGRLGRSVNAGGAEGKMMGVNKESRARIGELRSPAVGQIQNLRFYHRPGQRARRTQLFMGGYT